MVRERALLAEERPRWVHDPARLIARSPFCSSCPPPGPSPTPGPPKPTLARLPPGLELLSTQLALGRGSSVAVLRIEGRPLRLAVGAAVSGGAVLAAIEARAVLLDLGGELLRLGLDPGATLPAPGPGDLDTTTSTPPTTTPEIQEVDATTHKVSAALVERVFSEPASLMGQAFVVPSASGLSFRWVRAGSLLAQLGLRAGDRIESLNGTDVRDPARLLEAAFKLRGARHIELGVTRDGAATRLDYVIE
ncbi:MAG: hypothetical protein IT370_16770 [Deltaproteobacteria bacterium]|nr:hypothetical protein [Deltaproteobacteria bacterium]